VCWEEETDRRERGEEVGGGGENVISAWGHAIGLLSEVDMGDCSGDDIKRYAAIDACNKSRRHSSSSSSSRSWCRAWWNASQWNPAVQSSLYLAAFVRCCTCRQMSRLSKPTGFGFYRAMYAVKVATVQDRQWCCYYRPLIGSAVYSVSNSTSFSCLEWAMASV